MATIGEIFKTDPGYFQRKMYLEELLKDFSSVKEKVVNNDIYVGIEIEVEKTRAFNDKYNIWTYKADGSLRNNGLEWISFPIKGDCIPAALHAFYEGLNKDHHFSPRTSLHFHLDVRMLSLQELCSIVLTYLTVESLLYKFVGVDREKSIFCVPVYETNLVNDLIGFVNKKLVRFPMDNTRYAGLNLDAVRKFGTIEFRQLAGTNDINKIVTWINLLMSIYTYGQKQKLDKLISEIKELNTNSNYIAFVYQVFGGLSSKLDLTDVKNDLEKGVKAVKQSTISNKFFSMLKDHVSEQSKAWKFYNDSLPSANKVPTGTFRHDTEPMRAGDTLEDIARRLDQVSLDAADPFRAIGDAAPPNIEVAMNRYVQARRVRIRR